MRKLSLSTCTAVSPYDRTSMKLFAALAPKLHRHDIAASCARACDGSIHSLTSSRDETQRENDGEYDDENDQRQQAPPHWQLRAPFAELRWMDGHDTAPQPHTTTRSEHDTPPHHHYNSLIAANSADVLRECSAQNKGRVHQAHV